jgi:hypothetical protein
MHPPRTGTLSEQTGIRTGDLNNLQNGAPGPEQAHDTNARGFEGIHLREH